jgi:hypothetical protein
LNEGARKPETKADEVWFFRQRRERDEKKKKLTSRVCAVWGKREFGEGNKSETSRWRLRGRSS